MAISTRTRTHVFLPRLKALVSFQKFEHTLVEKDLQVRKQQDMGGYTDTSRWKKVDSRLFGVYGKGIPGALWIVLKILRGQGFQAYLVGGCVRDLLLNKAPKDYDVITTASLTEIKKQFHRSRIVGRRFPICMVNIRDSVIEVSSFQTPFDNPERGGKPICTKRPSGCNEKDFIRWRDCLRRDFTINSLFFDPFLDTIYDYANGMKDLKRLKLRTLIPAELSFKEDCARILRGLRIAARLGLSFSEDAETAICNLSESLKNLSTLRVMMELNYMLSYGAAESSLLLLQKFKLLELLLPFHAAYLAQQSSDLTSESPVMLLKLFSSLDKLLTCDKPSDCSLWVGLLAFHLALVNNPQDASVVWTFSSVLYHGNWKEGMHFARAYAETHINFVPEVSEDCFSRSEEELAKEVAQLASLVQDSVDILTETESLYLSMSKYPLAPCSGLVYVPKKMGRDVAGLFHVLVKEIKSYDHGRKSSEINYNLLQKGDPRETRYVLGKIIMDAMSNYAVQRKNSVKDTNAQETADFEGLLELVKEKCDFYQSNCVHKAMPLVEPSTGAIEKRRASKRKVMDDCMVSEVEMAKEKPKAVRGKTLLGNVAQKQEVMCTAKSKEMRQELLKAFNSKSVSKKKTVAISKSHVSAGLSKENLPEDVNYQSGVHAPGDAEIQEMLELQKVLNSKSVSKKGESSKNATQTLQSAALSKENMPEDGNYQSGLQEPGDAKDQEMLGERKVVNSKNVSKKKVASRKSAIGTSQSLESAGLGKEMREDVKMQEPGDAKDLEMLGERQKVVNSKKDVSKKKVASRKSAIGTSQSHESAGSGKEIMREDVEMQEPGGAKDQEMLGEHRKVVNSKKNVSKKVASRKSAIGTSQSHESAGSGKEIMREDVEMQEPGGAKDQEMLGEHQKVVNSKKNVSKKVASRTSAIETSQPHESVGWGKEIMREDVKMQEAGKMQEPGDAKSQKRKKAVKSKIISKKVASSKNATGMLESDDSAGLDKENTDDNYQSGLQAGGSELKQMVEGESVSCQKSTEKHKGGSETKGKKTEKFHVPHQKNNKLDTDATERTSIPLRLYSLFK